MENLKDIHIGDLLYKRVKEEEIEISRICKFLQKTEKEIKDMYSQKSVEADVLLKWCKLLEYDFFRLYSNHLILYAPSSGPHKKEKQSQLPQFRKNLYTKEIIDFMLELLKNKQMTPSEIMNQYRIPKSTLNKWISKYRL
ncbi:uroporphyrinogen-III decarboxylase [Chryseobacterium sediminis]|uniref:Uroporphyrinogen-III decarboxylase n=1 Tax=Chryseobacterium sediminis TaxID=1679494 RepID=A0ABR6PY59_9FLAO|nr:transposase [Chryseobacterium sediminis]MBB6330652.1 uroporphyrinogen-III decarboxylase [Chryseobacterium sediminis]